MDILKVSNLCKDYPAFSLSDVSFELEAGRITGFIGRNGAGKTTTMKLLFDFVHKDSGSVEFFSLPFSENQGQIKQRIGFVTGGVDYYNTKKLKTITGITRGFYSNWDEAAYREYLKLFSLDENKTPAQLSAGMKVKYSLALALSHRAELLVLDEPTSGLDPISRDELLSIFMDLSDKGVTILFSTHITSDLDRCADNIIYIKNGRIIAKDSLRHFVEGYRLAEFDGELSTAAAEAAIGCKRSKTGHTALFCAEDAERLAVGCRPADLEDIMLHMEKEEERI